jgi:hypothetical protein
MALESEPPQAMIVCELVTELDRDSTYNLNDSKNTQSLTAIIRLIA